MAMLVLTQLWINLEATGGGISAPTLGTDSESSVDGEVRTYAGGRQRYIAREGRRGQLQRTMRLMTKAQTEELEAWIGSTVLVRDILGNRWWGVFSKVTRHWIKGTVKYDLTIMVELVTQADGV